MYCRFLSRASWLVLFLDNFVIVITNHIKGKANAKFWTAYFLITYQRSEILLNGAQSDENGNGNGKDTLHNSKVLLSQLLANAPSFHEIYTLGLAGSAPTVRNTHKCCVYIADKSKYCVRLNSIQAFCDINRDVSIHNWCSHSVCLETECLEICVQLFVSQVVGDANHLTGYTFSSHNNIIDPSAELGSKTTVSSVLLIFCKITASVHIS